MNKRVKELRISKKLTQKQFGEMIGLKQNSIALIEIGKRNMSDSAVIALLSSFPDVNPDWFLDGTGDMYTQLTKDMIVAAEISALKNSDNSELKLECIHEILNFDKSQWDNVFVFISNCAGGVGEVADYVAKMKLKSTIDSKLQVLFDFRSVLDILIKNEKEKGDL